MSQELSYTFDEFNLIIRDILDSENISHSFQEHFNITWDSPFKGLRWNINTYKLKPYVPIETFIDIAYRRYVLNEIVRVDSTLTPIEIGDIVVTGSLTFYKIVGFSSQKSTSVKVQNIVDNSISYKHRDSILKMRDFNVI